DQGIGIALFLIDELRDADGAAGTRNVGHLHVAGNTFGGQRLLHDAGGLVPAAAGGRRSHDGVIGRKSRDTKSARYQRREKQLVHKSSLIKPNAMTSSIIGQIGPAVIVRSRHAASLLIVPSPR